MSLRKYLLYAHQNKANWFVTALQEHDWDVTDDSNRASFVLTDIDVNARRERIARLAKRGMKSFVYPHAARPDLIGDIAGYEAAPSTTAHFVATEGHAEIMSTYGYPHPMPVVGWYLSELRSFKPRPRVRNVLFAPIHCSPNGWLSPVDKDLNARTFEALHALVIAGKINLTVRYLYNILYTGIPVYPDVTYIKGNPNLQTPEADVSDVVISHQTFATICVAKGIPTVMMGEDVTPRLTLANGQMNEVRSWDKYRHLLMFPLDILNTPDPWELLNDAIKSDDLIADWKHRMIGERLFDGAHFVKTLEGYL